MENIEKETNMSLFALVGKDIAYSFSRRYFTQKFADENIANASYVNFDIASLVMLPKQLKQHQDHLKGLNVTIPYKQEIISYLDEMDAAASAIGAVNTIRVLPNGTLKGYNTDSIGFRDSLTPLLQPHHTKALILGTGGASKAVAYALQELGIAYRFVSRNPKDNEMLSYHKLTPALLEEYTLLINCSPVGTYPNTADAPELPYHALTSAHLLYDLIYNPEKTTFLQKGEVKGAQLKNGYEMLVLQAEASWRIWNTT